MRAGTFKLVWLHGRDWELCDMEADRTELVNLAGRNAPVERRLIRDYGAWADRVGVMDWEVTQPLLLKAWGLDSVEG